MTTTSTTGALRLHHRGFGFVEPESGPSIFAPALILPGLLEGDIVSAHARPGSDQATRISLVKRERTHVVGEVERDAQGTWLRVDSGTGNARLRLTRADSIPPGTCAHARLTTKGASVEEILGEAASDAALTRRVLVRHQLPWRHSSSETNEAANLTTAKRVRRGARVDLTKQHVITIDADHSVDLDDALSAQAAPGGAIRVWVHITDVAERIAPGSALDLGAAHVTTSIYLTTETRHMLPETLSAQALSLLPGHVRDVLTCELLIDAEGNIRSVDIYQARIRSRARLSYERAGELIHLGHSGDVDAATCDVVATLWAAASRLSLSRSARGGMDAFRADPEPAGERGTGEAHLLIERLMVATNEAVAEWLTERAMPGLYRTHAALSDDEATELEAAAAALGLHAALGRPVTPRAIAALAGAAAATSSADAFWNATMKLLARAKYEAKPGLHFGLGSHCYTHFTSPLRRYADLAVHRVVKAYLRGERTVEDQDTEELARHITRMSGRAAAAERDLERALALRDLNVGDRVSVLVLSRTGRSGRAMLGRFVVQYSGRAAVGARVSATVTAVNPLSGTLEIADGAKPRTTARRRERTTTTPEPPGGAEAAAAASPPEQRDDPLPGTLADGHGTDSAQATATGAPGEKRTPSKRTRTRRRGGTARRSRNRSTENEAARDPGTAPASTHAQTRTSASA